MIVAKIAKAVLKLILPDVTEHLIKVFKLEKIINYVELPNEADEGIKKLKVENEMVKGQLKDLVNDINKLKNIASKAKNIRSL